MSNRRRHTPKSASNFHLSVKASSASGHNMGPKSAVRKVSYDLGLDSKHGSDRSRILVVYSYVPPYIPLASFHPVHLARKCELRSVLNKKANGRTGQMLHVDVALPEIDHQELVNLGATVNQMFAETFEVPSVGAIHRDQGNPHLHASVPLYKIVPLDSGQYNLGTRINHALRPQQRKDLGLPIDRRVDLNNFRKSVANVIADAVMFHQRRYNPDRFDQYQISERWRMGYCSLVAQVQYAVKRGDLEFVLENVARAPTRKRGPIQRSHLGPADNEYPDESVAPEMDFRLCTEVAVTKVLQIAQDNHIDRADWVPRLMRGYGLDMSFPGPVNKQAKGVLFGFLAGPKFSGTKLGVPLSVLKKRFGWTSVPSSSGPVDEHTPPDRCYEQAVRKAGVKFKDLFLESLKYVQDWAHALISKAKKNRDALVRSLSSSTPGLITQTEDDAADVKERGHINGPQGHGSVVKPNRPRG